MLSLRCVMISLALLGAVAAQDGERPNIVWLVAEDMSPWLRCYGDATVPTPNCDRLAREGVRYLNAFATSPVCAPARSSLITGMYATRIGTMQMRNNAPSAAALEKNPEAYREIPGYEGLPPAFVRCFPEVLRRHDYYCSNNSKQDYQFEAPVTVWDDSSGRAHWRNRAAGQPFFAVFNYNGTHESQAFPDSKAKPSVVSPNDVPVPPIYPDTADVRQAMARTYDNIAAMDQWVGERLAELDQAGLLESTIVMFFSDHGVGLPRGKRSCYDTGTRVPLLVRFPDERLAGTVADRVVQFVDFGPTVLSLCGIRPDERLDGRAFLGGSERDGGGHAFSHADRFDETYDRQRSVTDGRYRYIRNYLTDQPYLIPNAYRERIPMTQDLQALRGRTDLPAAQWQMAATKRAPEEFYDSSRDAWEVVNLIDAPEHRERIAAMRQELDRWIESTNDLGFVLPESKLVREHIWPPDGVQPITPPATMRQQSSGDSALVDFECSEAGASIGFRILPLGKDKRWHVFSETMLVAAPNQRYEVRTHRIGWRPTTVEFEVGPRAPSLPAQPGKGGRDRRR